MISVRVTPKPRLTAANLFALALALTFASSSTAQPDRTTGSTVSWYKTDRANAIITGQVLDAYSGDPLPGATTVAGVGNPVQYAAVGASTDLAGRFQFELNILETDLRFIARFVGFNSAELPLQLAPGDSGGIWHLYTYPSPRDRTRFRMTSYAAK